MGRDVPLLTRDDPGQEPLIGNVKVTRADWLNLARDVLVHEGVGELKILGMSTRLGVSRSSFYWYFENREQLLVALLEEWESRNSGQIIAHCGRGAESIHAAVCNFFRCFVDPALFDARLDFAVREWARRDGALQARVAKADHDRLGAVIEMFRRYGYSEDDAQTRARVLYFMQLGYHALDIEESLETRRQRIANYLVSFTGSAAAPGVVEAFEDWVETLAQR
ncbi:TetR/AcrR family transcriptional regulator [Roseobacteraceae bacterium S113]